MLNEHDLQLVDLALAEDLGKPPKDLTTETLFGGSAMDQVLTADILSKNAEPIILCGVEIAKYIFKKFDSDVHFQESFQDGDTIPSGQTILSMKAADVKILSGERVALNFLQHLSAVATLTAKFVDRVKGSRLRILDTRKTTPGFRHLEKFAVTCGGGVNHRMGLYDAVLIKNNHIDWIGGIEKALEKIPENPPTPVIIEVRTIAELEDVKKYGMRIVNRVLLDNMDLKTMADCVRRCEGLFETEASGGITLTNIRAIAETGVGFASIGMLTYGAGRIDLAMHARLE